MKQNHFNALTNDEARSAYRVGTARALADLGMTPTEAEWALRANQQLSKRANDSLLGAAYNIGEGGLMGLALAGGAVGAATGHLRHQFENTVDGTEDPQANELQRKIQGYRKMKRELQTAQTAGITE